MNTDDTVPLPAALPPETEEEDDGEDGWIALPPDALPPGFKCETAEEVIASACSEADLFEAAGLLSEKEKKWLRRERLARKRGLTCASRPLPG